MRILLIDSKTKGHHLEYIRELARDKRYESVVLIPEDAGLNHMEFGDNTRFVTMISGGYGKILDQIVQTAEKYNVDAVHLVYADEFLKYFGFGLRRLKKYKTIATFHQFRYSPLRNLARRMMISNVDAGVVHTERMLSFLQKEGVKNAVHIEYPKLGEVCKYNKTEARERLGIKTEYPILLALGGTRYDKGLDLLLDALNYVSERFYLLIAGPAQDFSEEFIRKASAGYAENVKMILSFMPYKEFVLCSMAGDIVVLPYKKSFDGASGPLVEGVVYRKPIVGAEHGSLGEIIRNNHLGYTFESENRDQLVHTLNKALSESFQYDNTAELYAKSLDPQYFRNAYYKLYKE